MVGFVAESPVPVYDMSGFVEGHLRFPHIRLHRSPYCYKNWLYQICSLTKPATDLYY